MQEDVEVEIVPKDEATDEMANVHIRYRNKVTGVNGGAVVQTNDEKAVAEDLVVRDEFVANVRAQHAKNEGWRLEDTLVWVEDDPRYNRRGEPLAPGESAFNPGAERAAFAEAQVGQKVKHEGRMATILGFRCETRGLVGDTDNGCANAAGACRLSYDDTGQRYNVMYHDLDWTLQTSIPEGAITVGSRVSLSTRFRECSDASQGPLSPGDIGTVIEDDKQSKPFQVRAENGEEWWYTRDALVLAPAVEHEAIETDEVECGAECVVCMAKAAEVAIVPCGHKCLCTGCGLGANAVRLGGRCPTCRGPITTTMRIY